MASNQWAGEKKLSIEDRAKNLVWDNLTDEQKQPIDGGRR